MYFIDILNPGSDSRMILAKQDKPRCQDKQLVVMVKATAVNRADLLQCQGKYPPPQGESKIPGLEIAGDVVAVGKEVSRFKVGDSIFGLVGSGAYAQYCCIDESLATPLPAQWSYEYAAAIPEALTTAYATLFDLGQLQSQQTLLIHGAGSGISSFAIQMAKAIQAKVITTVGSSEKIQKAEALAADKVINHHEQNFADAIPADSVDLIVDFVGGDYFNQHLRLLKPKSRLIQISAMKSARVECDLSYILRKRLQINGFVLRPQSLPEKARLWQQANQDWMPTLIRGEVKPIIDSVFELNEIEEAHQRLKSGDHFGKIVVRIDEARMP